MALQAKVGTIDVPSANTTQVIAGVGFQPKALLFYSVSRNGNSADVTRVMTSYGIATDPSNQRYSVWYARQSGTSEDIREHWSNLSVMRVWGIWTGGQLTTADATLTAVGPDGFTLSWTMTGTYQNAAQDVDVHYLALGGDAVLDALVADLSPRSGTGTQTVTGLGFQPNALLFPLTRGQGVGSFFGGFGVVTPSDQWAWGEAAEYNGAGSRRRSGSAIQMQATSSTEYGVASVTSFDADGFTLNWQDNGPAAWKWPYLALNLATPPVAGSTTLPLSTGSKVLSGFAGAPKAVLLDLGHDTPSTANRSYYAHSTGLSDDITQVAGFQSRTNSYKTGRQTIGSAISLGNYLNANNPVLTEGTTTFDDDGFTIDLSTHDGVGRELFYLAFLDVAGTTHEDAASVAATSVLNATSQRERETRADVIAASDLDGTATADRHASITLDGTSEVDATASRMRRGEANVDAVSELAASSVRIREDAIDATASAAVTATSTTVLAAVSDVDALADLSATPTAIRIADTTIVAASESDAIPSLIAHAEAVLEAVTATEAEGIVLDAGVSLTIEAGAETSIFGGIVRTDSYYVPGIQPRAVVFPIVMRIRPSSAAIGGTSTLDSTVLRARASQLSLDATTALDVMVTMTVSASAELAGQADHEIMPVRIRHDAHEIDTTSVVDADAARVRSLGVDVVADAGMSADSLRLRVASAAVVSTLSLSAHPNARYAATTTVMGAAHTTIVVMRIRPDQVEAAAASALLTDAARVRVDQLPLDAVSVVTSSGIRIASGVLDVAAILDVQVIGTIDASGSVVLGGSSELRAVATPILVVTYEDAFGVVRQSLAVGEVADGPTSVRLHGPRSHVVVQPTPRSRPLPRTR